MGNGWSVLPGLVGNLVLFSFECWDLVLIKLPIIIMIINYNNPDWQVIFASLPHCYHTYEMELIRILSES